jgi:hypothetical protein
MPRLKGDLNAYLSKNLKYPAAQDIPGGKSPYDTPVRGYGKGPR